MNQERIKKLESVASNLISQFLIEDIKEIENDFGIISISKIRISSDVSYLDIYVSSFKNSEILTKTLAEYAPELTRKLHKQLTLRKLPRIRFRYDESWEISSSVMDTINNL